MNNSKFLLMAVIAMAASSCLTQASSDQYQGNVPVYAQKPSEKASVFQAVEVTITSWDDQPEITLHVGQQLNVHFRIGSYYIKPTEEKVEEDSTWAGMAGYKPLNVLQEPAESAHWNQCTGSKDFSYQANHVGIESLLFNSWAEVENGAVNVKRDGPPHFVTVRVRVIQ